MSYFYKNGHLRVGLPTAGPSQAVADAIGPYDGPVYLYDLDDVVMRFHAYAAAFAGLKHMVHYAMKANSHPLILARLASIGAGVDTVSAGEIRKALSAGFAPDHIIFSGVAKTKKEIEFAIETRIKQINVESPAELARIIEISRRKKAITDVAFRLNPDVNPKTHPYITTGFRENKFGMDESFLPELIRQLRDGSDAVQLRGLTMHIGSLLFDLDVLIEAMEKTVTVHHRLTREGFDLDRFDVGGGLGVHYELADTADELSMLTAYGERLQALVAQHLPAKVEILAEPGRLIVARSGLLVTEVQYIKRAPAKTFAIVDTGMHHFLRPALYQAKHRILTLRETAPSSPLQPFDVVGPICESSDVIGRDIHLPELSAGELLGVTDVGAYGYSMSSNYNSHAPPKEVVIENGVVL